MGNIISYFLDIVEGNSSSSNADDKDNGKNSGDSDSSNANNNNNTGDGGENNNDNSGNDKKDEDKGVDIIPEPANANFVEIDISIIDNSLNELQQQLQKMINSSGAQIIRDKEQSIINLYKSTCKNSLDLIYTQYSNNSNFISLCEEIQRTTIVDTNTFPRLIKTFATIANQTFTDARSTLFTIQENFKITINTLISTIESLKQQVKETNIRWNNMYGDENQIYKSIQETAKEYKGFFNGFNQSYTYISDNYNNTGIPIVTRNENNATMYVSYFAYYEDNNIVLVKGNMNVSFPYHPVNIAGKFTAPNGTHIQIESETLQSENQEFIYNGVTAEELINTLGKYGALRSLKNAANAILNESNSELASLQAIEITSNMKITDALATISGVFTYLRDMDEDDLELQQIQIKLQAYNTKLEEYGKLKKKEYNDKNKLYNYNQILINRKTDLDVRNTIYSNTSFTAYDISSFEDEDLNTKYSNYEAAFDELPKVDNSKVSTFLDQHQSFNDLNEAELLMTQFNSDWNKYDEEWKLFEQQLRIYSIANEEFISKFESVTGDWRIRYSTNKEIYDVEIQKMKMEINNWFNFDTYNVSDLITIFSEDTLLNEYKNTIDNYRNICFIADNNYKSQFENRCEEYNNVDNLNLAINIKVDNLNSAYDDVLCVFCVIKTKHDDAETAFSEFNNRYDELTNQKRDETIESNRTKISNDQKILNDYITTINTNETSFNTNYVNAATFNLTYGSFPEEIKEYKELPELTEVDNKCISTAEMAFNSWKKSYDSFVLISYTSIVGDLKSNIISVQITLNELLNDIDNSLADEWIEKYNNLNMSDIATVYISYGSNWNNYLSTQITHSNLETTFITAYSNLTGNFDSVYDMYISQIDSVIVSNENIIQSWKNNCPTISDRSDPTQTNNISAFDSLKTEIFERINYNDAVENYEAIKTKDELKRLKIDDLIEALDCIKNCFNVLTDKYSDLQDNAREINNAIAENQKKKENEAKQQRVDEWNELFKTEVQPIIDAKTETLVSYSTDTITVVIDNLKIDNIINLNCNCPNDSDLYCMLKCEYNNYDNKLEEAESKTSIYKTNVENLIITIQNINNDISDKSTQLKNQTITATIANINTLNSISLYKSTVESIDVISIEANINNAKTTASELVSLYNEIHSLIIEAGETMTILNPEFGEKYLSKMNSLNRNTLNTYKQLLSTQKSYMNSYYERCNYEYFKNWNYYSYLSNMIYEENKDEDLKCIPDYNICRTTTVNGKDVNYNNLFRFEKDNGTDVSLKQLWKDQNNLWNSCKEYTNENQNNQYAEYINEIEILYSNIETYTEKSKADLITSYQNLQTVENNYTLFDNAVKEFTTTTISAATFDFNTAETYYQTAKDAINVVFEALTKGHTYQAMDSVNQCHKLIVQTFNKWLIDTANDVNSYKSKIIKYQNAAMILSIVFGHNLVGLIRDSELVISFPVFEGYKKQTEAIYEYIKSLLWPSDYDVDVGSSHDVFEALCLYPSMQAIVWPDGASKCEKKLQEWKVTTQDDYIQFIKQDEFDDYIKKQLPVYLTTGIIRTMDVSSITPIVQYAQHYSEYRNINLNDSEIYKTEIDKYNIDYERYKKLKRNKYVYDVVLAALEDETKAIAAKTTINSSDINNKDELLNALNNETYEEFYNTLYFDYEMELAQLEISITAQAQNLYTNFDANNIIKNIYWMDFINEARNCRTDETFKSICDKYLNVPGKHTYWKLFRSLSGKFDTDKYKTIINSVFKSTPDIDLDRDDNYTRNNYLQSFPRLNDEEERKEAVIILMNRCFSYYGYVSTIEDGVRERLTWDRWIQSDALPITAGGQCIDYNDDEYYNSMSVGSDVVLNTAQSSTNNKKLKYFKKSTDFEKKGEYMMFSNPTADINFIFKDQVTIAEIYDLGIGNYLIGKTDISTAIENKLNEIVDGCTWINRTNVVSNTLVPYTSTDYIVYSEAYKNVFEKIVKSQYDWKLYFALSDPCSTSQYKISKINSYTYRNCGQMIYDIFNIPFFMTENYAKGGSVTISDEYKKEERTINDNLQLLSAEND